MARIIVKRLAAVLSILLSTAVFGQGYERVLLPISADATASDGTYWSHSAYISNRSGRDLRIGADLFPYAYCLQECPQFIPDGAMDWFTILHRESPAWPASILYLSNSFSSGVRFSSEVSASTDGLKIVSVPVVREKQFLPSLEIFPVDTSSQGRRVLLRIYDPDATPGGRIAVTFTASSGYVFRSMIVPLSTSGVLLGNVPAHPGYVQIPVEPSTIDRPTGAAAMRLTVTAIEPARRIWAMVTVTKRDNSVTLLSPSSSGEFDRAQGFSQ